MLIGFLPDGYRLRCGLDRNKPRDPAVPFCLSVKIATAVGPALLLLAPLATFVPGSPLPRPMTKDATKIKGRIREVVLLFNSVILLRSLSLSSESVVGEKTPPLIFQKLRHCGNQDG